MLALSGLLTGPSQTDRAPQTDMAPGGRQEPTTTKGKISSSYGTQYLLTGTLKNFLKSGDPNMDELNLPLRRYILFSSRDVWFSLPISSNLKFCYYMKQ